MSTPSVSAYCDFSAELTRVAEAVPTMYVIAEHWAATAIAFLGRNFPKVTTSTFGGHMMFWEYAERFNTTIDEFLAG